MDVTSNMAGTVVSVKAQPGEDVHAGQEVVVLESMKMEIGVAAPAAGRVAAVHVQARDQVDEGQSLFSLEG
jgi:acetyl-CoA carboxylase biotin carboxyl carrier protein